MSINITTCCQTSVSREEATTILGMYQSDAKLKDMIVDPVNHILWIGHEISGALYYTPFNRLANGGYTPLPTCEIKTGWCEPPSFFTVGEFNGTPALYVLTPHPSSSNSQFDHSLLMHDNCFQIIGDPRDLAYLERSSERGYMHASAFWCESKCLALGSSNYPGKLKLYELTNQELELRFAKHSMRKFVR